GRELADLGRKLRCVAARVGGVSVGAAGVIAAGFDHGQADLQVAGAGFGPRRCAGEQYRPYQKCANHLATTVLKDLAARYRLDRPNL
ncbi:hypothetical protein, partial [Stenotrophomonas maltophilia]|uniref:hypothetical protein n=1 Tax=Stenotrophomonas maltophilia TaxID=40324 RepID=UPI001A7E05C3